MTDTCETCIFFKRAIAETDATYSRNDGECFRFPPVGKLEDKTGNPNFAETWQFNWCGEYRNEQVCSDRQKQ